MEGIIFALILATAGLIAKAVLEAVYFKDRNSAKKTLFLWVISAGSLCFALGLSFLFLYFEQGS